MSESRITGIVKASATKNRLRMSRAISVAMSGEDMSWPMPALPASATGGSCSCSVGVCGSSYCMRSAVVQHVIGVRRAVCASSDAVGPSPSPAIR